MDNWFETIVTPFAALAALVAGIALVYAFRRPVNRLMREFRIAKISALGIGVEFVDANAVKAYEKQGLGPPSADDMRRLRKVANHLAPLAAQRRILWVDDNPANNQLERAAFRDWRVEVQTRRTTDDALVELRDRAERYDIVVSDWARSDAREGDESSAGMRLAKSMRAEGILTPVVFYHGRVPHEELDRRNKEAGQVGALGATGSPGELYRLVLMELARHGLDE